MKKAAIRALVAGAFALGATAAFADPAPVQTQQVPKGWSYEVKNGQRVPKSNRVTNADGSWREELKQGNCMTVKQKSVAGEYKETRECNQN